MPWSVRDEPAAVYNWIGLVVQSTTRYSHSTFPTLIADGCLEHFEQITLKWQLTSFPQSTSVNLSYFRFLLPSYQILLSGLHFDDHGRGLRLRDAELASLRKTQELEVLCGDTLPRELTDIRRLTSKLPGRVGPLDPPPNNMTDMIIKIVQ